MKTKLLALAAATLAAAATAATAGAVNPSVTEVNVDRTFHFAAGTVCSFPVTIHNEGRNRTTTYFDQAGNVTRTVIHLNSFTQSVTNDLTGETLSTPLAGPAIIEPNGDGTVTTTIPGNDGRIVVPGQGFVYADLGLIVFTAPAGSPFTQLDVLMLTGHYEQPDLYTDALCASLS
jgi:hypothetical protein